MRAGLHLTPWRGLPSPPFLPSSAAGQPLQLRAHSPAVRGGPLSHRSRRHSGSPGRPRQREGGKRPRTSRHRAGLAAISGPASAMASWALLCLGGALVYSQLHSLSLTEGSRPAQGQATTPGPPEEEQPVTKGSIWSCAAPAPGDLARCPTSATQDSAAPRPLVAMSVIPQKCSALIFLDRLTDVHGSKGC